MSDVRQNSLFYLHPNSPEEINRHTPMAGTIELFKDHLTHEGKTENTVKSFESDLQLVIAPKQEVAVKPDALQAKSDASCTAVKLSQPSLLRVTWPRYITSAIALHSGLSAISD